MCARTTVIVECPSCLGERMCEGGPSGWESAPWGIDRRDGGLLTDWIVCTLCDGDGEIEEPVTLVDEYDLDDIPMPA